MSGPADVCPPGFATRGRLARIRGQNILFSAPRRAIFTLNDTAADIWRSLEAGLSPAAIASGLADRGADAPEARRHVERALEEWQRLGLVEPALPGPSPAGAGRSGQVVAVGGLAVRILYPAGFAPAAAVFRHLETDPDAPADLTLELVRQRDRVQLFRDGTWLASCLADEVPTVVKGQVLSEVLERADYALALHGAALVRDGRILLLCGRPGAGKTTLTLALVHAGFGLAGDDVMLLAGDGRGVGLPFAPAVKSGAWPLLADRVPGLATAPAFRRPDRRRVRYPAPEAVVDGRPRPLGWVVLLDRGAEGRATLAPVDAAGALGGLLDGAFAPDRQLGLRGFDALARVVDSAETWRLSYAALDEAVALLDGACR